MPCSGLRGFLLAHLLPRLPGFPCCGELSETVTTLAAFVSAGAACFGATGKGGMADRTWKVGNMLASILPQPEP